jgi:hypothetical protein
VEFDDFQESVLELAQGGTRITKGNVALRLQVTPERASSLLDRMAKDGVLELDIDERSNEIYYEVRRGHRAPATSAKNAANVADAAIATVGATVGKALGGGSIGGRLRVGSAVTLAKAAAASGVVPADQRRKIGVGILLGGLFPGFGLLYSAPWPIAIAASLVVALGFKIISLIPLFSSFLLIPFVAVCAVASAVLGGLYTWQYNQTGKRTPLGDEPISPKQLLKRFRSRE